MHTFKKTLLASSLLLATAAAQAEVSGNIGVTSDYLWRGVSQSDTSASVSGGIDYADDSGFYAGTWVGSLGDSASGFNGAEVDLYAGYSTDLFDVGYIYYMYPSLDDADFGEIYGSLSFSGFTVGLAYTVNSEGDEDTGLFVEGDLYYYASWGTDLGEDWSFGVTVGAYTFDNDDLSAPNDADYVHYSVDFGKSTDLGDFTFTISDTNADSADLAGINDDPVAVVSWGIGF